MIDENKKLAVELASSIITGLKSEPILNEKGELIDVNINSLLQACYDAIKNLK